MTAKQPDFQTLNAYADGELDPREALVVAKAAASNPEIADELAHIHAMKAAVSSAYNEAVIVRMLPPQKARGWFLSGTLVASVVCLVAGYAVLSGLMPTGPGVESGKTAEQFLASHDTWSRSETDAIKAAAFPNLLLPDLSLAKMSIVSVQPTRLADGTEAMQIGYVGKNGCQLSFFAVHGKLSSGTAALTPGAGFLAESWQADGMTYVAIARHMNADRFAALATALRLATVNGVHLHQDARTALMNAHQPCIS